MFIRFIKRSCGGERGNAGFSPARAPLALRFFAAADITGRARLSTAGARGPAERDAALFTPLRCG